MALPPFSPRPDRAASELSGLSGRSGLSGLPLLRPMDAALDLALGSRCVGCRRPGRLLCGPCEDGLPERAQVAWPRPSPEGLVPPYAVGPYAGALRALVIGLKEQQLWSLADPLAVLLAQSVAALAAEQKLAAPIVLVPVPSRAASVRARALDSTWTVTRRAALSLGVAAVPLLRMRVGVRDQAGLDSGQRALNLTGSMTCPSAGLRRLARITTRATVVICDDVLTTGATTREAQRALGAVGVSAAGIAVVAATQRRAAAGAQR